ncbi:hypothetical protein B0O80DRAFT_500814 [Mortierella sp. GBAus27b]|nr:hypothetical protein BGX31_000378 [Mortierella sp. GBA43]KAI8350221.1 hypothetical protein B0O80DRAFT_500814 [Mortierella sp. GBAus27b]
MALNGANDLPAVMIVGGGLGGLLLGILLESINIPFHIFERATEVQPHGEAVTVGPNILPVFEQLGLLQEIEAVSAPCPTMDFYGADMKKIGVTDLSAHKQIFGYDNLLCTRSRFYDILRGRIPPRRISYGKRVLRTEEKNDKIYIYCSDGTSYEGDILVGADGANSSVRQSLYKRMERDGHLPKSDSENSTTTYVSMVGVADIADTNKFPQVKDSLSHYSQVLGKDSRSWGVFSVTDNQVCWGLSSQLNQAQAKELPFRNSDSTPESNGAMLKEFRDLPCPWGGTMGEIFDATSPTLISKVFLGEKLFKTWYHGRTVLIGDACHKMLHGAGQGAVNAMQDAVVLANCIYKMVDTSLENITAAFQDYYTERYHRADKHSKRGNVITKAFSSQTWPERVARQVLMNFVPNWIHQKAFIKSFEYRPQIEWLAHAPNRGTGKVLSQTRSIRSRIC